MMQNLSSFAFRFSGNYREWWSVAYWYKPCPADRRTVMPCHVVPSCNAIPCRTVGYTRLVSVWAVFRQWPLCREMLTSCQCFVLCHVSAVAVRRKAAYARYYNMIVSILSGLLSRWFTELTLTVRDNWWWVPLSHQHVTGTGRWVSRLRECIHSPMI